MGLRQRDRLNSVRLAFDIPIASLHQNVAWRVARHGELQQGLLQLLQTERLTELRGVAQDRTPKSRFLTQRSGLRFRIMTWLA